MNRIVIGRRRWLAAVLFAVVCLTPLPLQAQQDAKVKKVVAIEGITEYRLDNGVRFVLFPDPASSTVTVNMTVFVGSRHEGYGETGMAHLLEHMLFKGSKAFPNVDKALQEHGAEANGTTWVDRTNYYETMPATDANLEFGIKLEADRLINSFIRREDLVKEMTVVRNEFEQGENDPEGILSQRMMAAAYEWHNYGKSTIGNRTDIERVPIDRLVDFYKKYYQPDNIMLVVAGKFDEKKALGYITQYVGALPRPARTLDRTYTEEPPQDGERTVILRRVGNVSVVGLVYHVPAAAHEDFPAIDVLDTILTIQPSGRLYKALVETKKASRVSSSAFGWHDPGVLEVSARVADKVKPEEVRDIIIDELENLANKPITAEEVERAKLKYKVERERALTKSKSIALELSEWAGAGDWRLLFVHRDRIAKVTPDDVMRVAKKYFTKSNRTVGIFYPTPAKDLARAPIPTTPSVEQLVKDYKGGKAIAAGEAFDPTPANLEGRTKRLELPGGLKVALLPKKTRGETVVGTLTLHFGNEKSLNGQTTASTFLGSLMMRGTKKHSRQEIQDLLDKLGSKLNGSSGPGSLSFTLESKRENLPAVLDLLHEILREPIFPEKELDILKRNSRQGIERKLTDPQALAFNAFTRKLHPYPKDNIRYRPTIAESLERLDQTTLAQVVKLYNEQIGGGAGEFVLVGDFDADPSLKKIQAMTAVWKASVSYERITQTAKVDTPGSKENILTPDKEGATYVAGHLLSLTDANPDYPALVLGNYILGESSTSRLFDRLRQKEGLSYGAGSRFSADAKDPYGMFMVFAICNPENIDKADSAAMDVVAKTLKSGITAEELTDGRKGYLEDFKVGLSTDHSVAEYIRDGLYHGRTMQYYADLEKKISALSVQDINRALAAHVAPQRLVVIRAGDFTKKAAPK